MRSTIAMAIVLATVLIAGVASAVLPPWAYEARRIKADAVFLAEVVKVHQAGSARYHTVMAADLKVIKAFRGSPPSSGMAKALYASLSPGDRPPPGPTLYNYLKPGELVLVFAGSFAGQAKAASIVEAGEASGAAAGHKLAESVAHFQRQAGYLATKADAQKLYRVDPARAQAQLAMYRQIIAYLQGMK